MTTISLDEIARDLKKFFKRVQKGESFFVTKNDQTIAEIQPIHSNSDKSRPYGLCSGEFVVPDDFDDELPEEIIRLFEK
ncbi:type II toxin-antitoxin system Phd/YefM family antitoxin [candidate division KSB1 bacterium]|nr:type II toxin-antitoxin system Phd/YefM family antitoxin [candidate division KSB1 bacterium]